MYVWHSNPPDPVGQAEYPADYHGWELWRAEEQIESKHAMNSMNLDKYEISFNEDEKAFI
ncbi:hypothetical protein LKD70_09015 [Ruminococcus sp. CLA-AA-H200]|uniref:Uncharacterized protein n=1 Tax=Ruminococcus turbiniformis TaxID=2881258 RepID=A0ABS8FY86_9FIRM|nr:hypothetical protein [Ruminococcus turbiniformis]MCC2254554.1 hypothetical protein [Ruminococcus turbiniformis]